VRRIFGLVSIAVAVALALVGVSLVSLYNASQRVPEFYDRALKIEPKQQTEARDTFVAQATALASDLHAPGHWQSLFTAEQINAWLALELGTNYPHLLPEELREPRISIADGQLTVGCRYTHGEMATVLSLSVEAYLHEPNVLALRIRRARAGALPVPLSQVLDGIAHAAAALNLRLEWSKAHGDPVALVTLPERLDGDSTSYVVEKLELRDGELFVAGTANRLSPGGSPIVPRPQFAPTANKAPTGPEPAGDQPLVGAAEKDTLHK
jgi:hypothetical protein